MERAPTYYGQLSMTIESKAATDRLIAEIQMPQRRTLGQLIVRFRHPQKKPIRAVSVNGQSWTNYDTAKEWVVVPGPREERYTIIAYY
jgi:hypothetical protein